MKAAIIDDCQRDRETLENYLTQYFSEHDFNITLKLEHYTSCKEFLNDFCNQKYEIIFIDYYMTDSNGLDLAKQIRQQDRLVPLIFISNSRDFAIDAYKVKASDYLVKPYDYQQLCTAIELLNLKKIKENQYIELTTGQRTLKIYLKDIVYCDSSGHYTQIHKADNTVERVRRSFFEISEQLSQYAQFYPCYRGCIINMNHITRINALNFVLSNGDSIPFRKKEYHKVVGIYSNFLLEEANLFDT